MITTPKRPQAPQKGGAQRPFSAFGKELTYLTFTMTMKYVLPQLAIICFHHLNWQLISTAIKW